MADKSPVLLFSRLFRGPAFLASVQEKDARLVRVGGAIAARSTARAGFGYTLGMKTAVSLPDDVFTTAERLAKRLRMSRSELYRRAIDEFVSRHSPDAVTEALDRVCAELGGQTENEFSTAAARQTLERAEW